MKIRFSRPKEQQNPEQVHGIKVPYTPGKRSFVRWRWLLIVALVISPFVYLLFNLLWPHVMVTASGFILLEKNYMTAPVSAVVAKQYVKVGDFVRVGQELVLLSSEDLEVQIKKIRAELAERVFQESRARFLGNNEEHVLRLYKQQEEQALFFLQQQQARWKEAIRLQKDHFATEGEVAALRSLVEAAKHTLIQARLDRKGAEERVHERITAADSPTLAPQRTEDLLHQLKRYEGRRRLLLVRASEDGAMLDIPASPGKVLEAGELVATVGSSPVTVIAYLRPEQAKYAKPGTIATVSLPSGAKIRATVRNFPTQSKRLPADLSSPIGTRDIMIITELELVQNIPLSTRIDGLPVSVLFHRFHADLPL